jgi:Protein of unknown function (DUF2752)
MRNTHWGWLKVAMVVTGGIIVGMLFVFDPATTAMFPPCPVRYLTGWYCPGCGSLRAMHQLMHGNLHAAWAMNPLTVIFLPFVAYGLVSHVLLEIRGRALPQFFIPASYIRALGVIVILFAIARNLPLYPFNLLAPGAMLRP